MKLKALVFVLFLPVLLEVACCNCEFESSIVTEYSNCSISVNNVIRSSTTPQVSLSNQIQAETFGLRLNIHRKTDICQVKNQFHFLTTALATSCHCPNEFETIGREIIESINIINVNDFGSDFPAFSSVNSFFQVRLGMNHTTIENWIENEVFRSNYPFEEVYEIDLMLTETPEFLGTHIFQIEVTFSDGKTYDVTSTPVYLN